MKTFVQAPKERSWPPLVNNPACNCVIALSLAVMGLVSPLHAAEALANPEINGATPINPQLVERWDAMYRSGRRPPWETGRPSTELKRLVEQQVIRPCRVLELGCGTGENAVYLASQKFDVTAIDLAPTALKLAEERAQKAGAKVRWIQADVLNPPALKPFDLIFDRGCYHGVRRQNATGYVTTVKTLCRPDGHLLILAGNANEPGARGGPPRVDETELVGDFAGAFDFERLREIRFDTADPKVPGAWAWSLLLRRKPL